MLEDFDLVAHPAALIELSVLFDNNILVKHVILSLISLFVEYLVTLGRKDITIVYLCQEYLAETAFVYLI
jgi:hypothetical protein